MASSFICAVGEWKQGWTNSSGLGTRMRGGLLRISSTWPSRLGGCSIAKVAKRSPLFHKSTLVGSISKERSSVETDERSPDVQMTVDHDTSSHQTQLSFNGKHRVHLVPELVFLCSERSLNIEHLVFRSENEWISCNVELSKNGAKLSAEETQRLQRDFQELTRRQSEEMQHQPVQTKSTSDPELPYIDYRDRYVDYERGVAFYTDNHATPTYTTLTAIVPNYPYFLVQFMKQLSQMPLQIIFASLSTYNREGKTRHDVYHIVTKDGEQLDAAQCDALVDVVSGFFEGEKISKDGI